jgi:Ca2+/Na+ antiporter
MITANIILMVSFSPHIIDSGKKLAFTTGLNPFILGLVLMPFLGSFHEILTSILYDLENPALNQIVLSQQMGNKFFELLITFSIIGFITCRQGKCIRIDKDSERFLTIRNGSFMLFGVALLAILLFSDNNLSIADGFILLLFYAFFIAFVYLTSRNGVKEADVEQIGEEEIKEKGKINAKLEFLNLFVAISIIALLANATVNFSSYLIDSFAFFQKYSFLVIGIIFALPNLILSVVGIKKGSLSLVVSLNIGSTIWELSISVAVIAFTAPITAITTTTIFIIAVSLIAGSIATLVFIRTKWTLSAWECMSLFSIYIGCMVFIILFA